MPVNPTSPEAEAGESEAQVILGYTANLRPAWAT